MTRLSVERLEEIRARVVRWASVPFAMSGTLADYVKKANEAHTWPGAERDEEHVAEAESWAEMIGDDPVVGVLVDALRLANRDRADLLAELDAVREELGAAQAELRGMAWGALNAERSTWLAEQDDFQARLLVMTRERDEAREFAARGGLAPDAWVERERARADAAEAQREELAAALEHLRGAVVRRLAEDEKWRSGNGDGRALLAAHVALDAALALPTSEAAIAARRGWEAKGIEEAAKEAERYDDKALAAWQLYELAEAKRQGGGT